MTNDSSPTAGNFIKEKAYGIPTQGDQGEVDWTLMAKKTQMVIGTWGIRSSFHSLIGLLLTVLIIAAVYLTQDSGLPSEDRTCGGDSLSHCNLFSGKWVFDNQTYPLYKENQCTFMSDQLACGKFGRKDLSYQNWRWQPHQCNLPRYIYTYIQQMVMMMFKVVFCLCFWAICGRFCCMLIS